MNHSELYQHRHQQAKTHPLTVGNTTQNVCKDCNQVLGWVFVTYPDETHRCQECHQEYKERLKKDASNDQWNEPPPPKANLNDFPDLQWEPKEKSP